MPDEPRYGSSGRTWYKRMKRVISLLLLVLLAAIGCIAAPPADDIDLSDYEGQLCMTLEDLEATTTEAYDNGYIEGQRDCKQPDVALAVPTYDELIAWLKVEPSQDCVLDTKNCVERAENLGNSAREQGYDMYCILLNFKGGSTGHVIVAFPTEDAGVVYVEPILNITVNVDEGHDYSINFDGTIHEGQYPTAVISQVGIVK